MSMEQWDVSPGDQSFSRRQDGWTETGPCLQPGLRPSSSSSRVSLSYYAGRCRPIANVAVRHYYGYFIHADLPAMHGGRTEDRAEPSVRPSGGVGRSFSRQ